MKVGEAVDNNNQSLINMSENDYGQKYREHILEIYKVYLTSIEKISDRRQINNSFFLTINTGLVGIVSYLNLGHEKTSNPAFFSIVALAGMVICYMWYRLVRSYRDLNRGKFKIIHQLEEVLPISAYDAEWKVLGSGKNPKIYLPFTDIEMKVPWIFFTLHLFVFLNSLPWRIIVSVFQ